MGRGRPGCLRAQRLLGWPSDKGPVCLSAFTLEDLQVTSLSPTAVLSRLPEASVPLWGPQLHVCHLWRAGAEWSATREQQWQAPLPGQLQLEQVQIHF